LRHLDRDRPVVLGLPRGGVPVAAAVAAALDAPLDVVLVRKLGVPGQPELALGAVGEGGVRVLNEDVLRWTGVAAAAVDVITARERAVLDARAAGLRSVRPRVPLEGRCVVLVDDGIATGATVRAACAVVRAAGAARVVVAAPVAPAEVQADLAAVADEVVVVATPSPFGAVGAHYVDFAQVPDEAVLAHLAAPVRQSAS
jgi:predicted phosphoribosyltransferase